MSNLSLEDLSKVYQCMRPRHFGAVSVLISSPELKAVLQEIDDEASSNPSGIRLTRGVAGVGEVCDIVVERPSPAIGSVYLTTSEMLNSRDGWHKEPDKYYIIDINFMSNSPVIHQVELYRSIIQAITIICESASFANITQRLLMFIGDNKIKVPVKPEPWMLSDNTASEANALSDIFANDLHRDQKLSILKSAIDGIVLPLREEDRFSAIMRNLKRLKDEVENGYVMFASSFSYSKIRSDVEKARFEFASKINKTLTDVQAQVLGLPLATVVVATQMKPSNQCDYLSWTNWAIASGAILFSGFLLLGVLNQIYALKLIKADISKEKGYLVTDYPLVAPQFASIYDDLDTRMVLQRRILIGVIALAIACMAGSPFLAWKYETMPAGALCPATPMPTVSPNSVPTGNGASQHVIPKASPSSK